MSHQKKHTLPPHNRRRQKTANETLRHDGRYTGGENTLGNTDAKKAPLWEGSHGQTTKP